MREGITENKLYFQETRVTPEKQTLIAPRTCTPLDPKILLYSHFFSFYGYPEKYRLPSLGNIKTADTPDANA